MRQLRTTLCRAHFNFMFTIKQRQQFIFHTAQHGCISLYSYLPMLKIVEISLGSKPIPFQSNFKDIHANKEPVSIINIGANQCDINYNYSVIRQTEISEIINLLLINHASFDLTLETNFQLDKAITNHKFWEVNNLSGIKRYFKIEMKCCSQHCEINISMQF